MVIIVHSLLISFR